jgi:hypothetical protein
VTRRGCAPIRGAEFVKTAKAAKTATFNAIPPADLSRFVHPRLRATPVRAHIPALVRAAPRRYSPAMIRTLAVLSLLALPGLGPAQGKLDEVREAVDKPSKPDDTARDSSSDSSAGDDTFLGLLFAGTGGDDAEEPTATFNRYPYADPGTAYLRLNSPEGGGLAARGAVEVGSDFDGLDRTGLKLFLDTTTRLGLKTDWDCYSERLACGCRDSFWLADITPTYRAVQSEVFQLHLGLGLRLLLDHGRDRGGWNLLAGFDLFPGRPVHVFGSAEAGTVGNAGLYHFRGGAGVTWRRLEGYAGYDYVRIGGVELQGPFVGVRVWY